MKVKRQRVSVTGLWDQSTQSGKEFTKGGTFTPQKLRELAEKMESFGPGNNWALEVWPSDEKESHKQPDRRATFVRTVEVDNGQAAEVEDDIPF